jgi:RimJ/RimL family protein N-acetyltransferase
LKLCAWSNGGGFATDAAIAFLRFGWEELKLRRILATVEQGNDASTHILQKLRFVVIETEECRQQRHRRL